MYSIKIILTIFSTIIIFGSCNQRTLEPGDSTQSPPIVPTYGTDTTFDIATWNIEHFPLQGSITLDYVTKIVKNMDIDLIGLQEMDDTGAFYRLLDSLPEYNGVLSNQPTHNLKLGIIYKKDLISVSNVTQIFTDDSYAFPRPPFMAYVEVNKENSIVFDFTLFVLHLKAFGGEDNEERRRDACVKLKSYIDTNILPSQDKDVIILGDLNDELDDPAQDNVFQAFLNDSLNYVFLSYSLLGQSSYPGSNSLIDHILITNDALLEYGNGNTAILDLDHQFDQYSTYVSDHRPVLSQFRILGN